MTSTAKVVSRDGWGPLPARLRFWAGFATNSRMREDLLSSANLIDELTDRLARNGRDDEAEMAG